MSKKNCLLGRPGCNCSLTGTTGIGSGPWSDEEDTGDPPSTQPVPNTKPSPATAVGSIKALKAVWPPIGPKAKGVQVPAPGGGYYTLDPSWGKYLKRDEEAKAKFFPPVPSGPCICKKCNEKNDYAEPNQPDGGYVCYQCR